MSRGESGLEEGNLDVSLWPQRQPWGTLEEEDAGLKM